MNNSHDQAISTLQRLINGIRIFSLCFTCANSKFYFFVAVRSNDYCNLLRTNNILLHSEADGATELSRNTVSFYFSSFYFDPETWKRDKRHKNQYTNSTQQNDNVSTHGNTSFVSVL